MQEIRTLYVSDLDGTLLDADSRVSGASVAMLNRAIEQYGAMFTCATARTPATMVPLMADVHMQLPMIAMAGAAMWNPLTQGYENVRTIPESVIRQVVAVYEKHGSRPFVYRQHQGVIEAYHSSVLSDAERGFVEPRSHGEFKRFVLGEGYGTSADEAMIIFSLDDYAKLKQIYDEIVATIDCTPQCYHDIFDFGSGILEVYSQGTTKAQAISTLAGQVGANRIVVFGDNRNDLPMMQIADHSVAVANAFAEVQQAADEIIGANTENSVARWIESDAKAIYDANLR